MEAEGKPYRLYFYISPYKRSHQTFQALADNFDADQMAGYQEEVQLREQDFGNFQVCNCLHMTHKSPAGQHDQDTLCQGSSMGRASLERQTRVLSCPCNDCMPSVHSGLAELKQGQPSL